VLLQKATSAGVFTHIHVGHGQLLESRCNNFGSSSSKPSSKVCIFKRFPARANVLYVWPNKRNHEDKTMNHKRQLYHFCLGLTLTCLAAPQAIAAEEDTVDKILFDCTFRNRDTLLNPDGSFRRPYVSSLKNPATGTVGDLRLSDNTTNTRSRFSMIWRGTLAGANLWYITPDHAPKCMQDLRDGVNALTCNKNFYVFLTINDGYYVISDFYSGAASWKAPADPNSNGYLTSQTFSSSAPESTRRRFHWEIRDCKNLIGEFKSPAP
jgi:hypothetical protein